MQQEVFSLAPDDHPVDLAARKPAAVVAIGVMAAVVLVALFFVSQRFDSGAHHYDTAASQETLPTLRPQVPAPPAVTAGKFYAADARFRAVFDRTPARSVQSFTAAGNKLSMTIYDEDNADSELTIGSMPLPANVPFDLRAGLEGMASVVHAELGSTYSKTFQGNDAYEGVIAAGCGCDLVKAFMMIVRTNDRVVFIFGGADHNSEQRYVAFRDSIELL